MGLKQMGYSRMSTFEPPKGVMEGGRVGRPKLLHNGTGAGLTGGGGLNAKGSASEGIKVPQHMKGVQRTMRKAKYAANKTNAHKQSQRKKEQTKRNEKNPMGGKAGKRHITGRFQYGDGQWGSINKRGQVDWKKNGPGKGKKIIGYNQAQPWLKKNGHMTKRPVQKALKAYYLDSIYARQMGQHNQSLNTSKADYSSQKRDLRRNFKEDKRNMTDSFNENKGSINAEMGASNMAGSGISAATLGNLSKAFSGGMSNIRKKNSDDVAKNNLELSTAQRGYNSTKAGELGIARDRWKQSHLGKKPPKSAKGFWKDKGRQMRTNKQGIPTTWKKGK